MLVGMWRKSLTKLAYLVYSNVYVFIKYIPTTIYILSTT
jgi:hypothetical protein